ncbi:putative periplasmic serine endoprotease DegP-like [Gammaproteobacteria bacterium]
MMAIDGLANCFRPSMIGAIFLTFHFFQGAFMALKPYFRQLILSVALLSLSGWVAAAGLPDFTGLVEKASPAVVNISTKSHTGKRQLPKSFNMPDLPDDSPLNDLFRRFFGEEGEGEGSNPHSNPQARSLGSGFFISPDGYILTNYHVVNEADEILVRTVDRREFTAKVIGSDKRTDIALIKIDAKNVPVVKPGSSKNLKVGEWVLAIGSPFGFDYSATAGIVSAKGRSLPSENYVPFIQTDVAINPGNSGGPLFNLDGEVIGINSQIYSRSGGYMGLSFAVPIDVAMSAVEQIKSSGHVRRGWLGVLIQDVTRDLAETFGLDHPQGALVSQVLPNSPAAEAGLKPGDVILQFNGEPLATASRLPPLVGTSTIGSDANLLVMRGGKQKSVTLHIGELPNEDQAAKPGKQSSASVDDRLGLAVRNLSPEQRQKLDLSDKGGVWVESVDEGAAKNAGLRRGDVILIMDGQEVKDASHFHNLVKDLPTGKSVALLIQRDEGRLFLALKTPE